MDVLPADRDGSPAIEYSWEGTDEGDHVSGRGWAVLRADGSLSGRIYFYRGDESSFRAEPMGRPED
jgi:hypothetical protein